MKPKIYLGDGVFLELNGARLILFTEDGARVTNQITLEPEVYNTLAAFVQAWQGREHTRPHATVLDD